MWNAIIKLIEKWSCMHDWDFHAERKVERTAGFGQTDVYFRRTYICKKCGEFKQIKV